MKQTLSTSQIADALIADEYSSFSYYGARALAEYLEAIEEDTGTELELDTVAIRCDYSEHDSLTDWAHDFFGFGCSSPEQMWKDRGASGEETDEEKDEILRDYIRARGELLEFKGGIIVSNF